MIYKTQSPVPGHVRVTFELPSCVWADRIFLVGDFNGWDEHTTPMQQDRDGVWRATVDLAYGSRCEFRYLIDGHWQTDYHADGQQSNTFGTENSVVCATLPGRQPPNERLSSLVLDSLPIEWTRVQGKMQPLEQKRAKRERVQRSTFAPTQAAA